MCEREASVFSAASGGGDTGHDFKWNSGFIERDDFFAATAKNIRIAALQTHDRASRLSFTDESCIDLGLGHNQSVIAADPRGPHAQALCQTQQ